MVKKRPKRTPELIKAQKLVMDHARAHQGVAVLSRMHKVKDTPINLLRSIKEGKLDASHLSPKQRRACLTLLLNGTHTRAELAQLFKVSIKVIHVDITYLRNEYGKHIKEWSQEEVIGHLGLAADKYSAEAMKLADPGLAWKIQLDFAKTLNEWGIVGPKQTQDGIRVTVEALGERAQAMKAMLARAMDPRLTGEHVDHETIDVSPLPLKTAHGEPGATKPPIEIVVEE